MGKSCLVNIKLLETWPPDFPLATRMLGDWPDRALRFPLPAPRALHPAPCHYNLNMSVCIKALQIPTSETPLRSWEGRVLENACQ